MNYSLPDPFSHLNSLFPQDKDLFSIKEVAKIINKSTQFTRDAFRNGKILGYALSGRSLNKKQKRSSYLIHKNDIIAYLIKHANHSPQDFQDQILHLLSKGTKNQLEFFQAVIQTKLHELSQHPETTSNPDLPN